MKNTGPTSEAGLEKYSVKNIYKRLSENRKSEGSARYLKVSVPGSKSITNRALLIATLAKGDTKLSGVLFSDDSRNFLKCVQELGVETEVDEDKKIVTVHGCNGKIPKNEADIYVGSAGTAARFITATLGVLRGRYGIDSSEQMRKRPMEPLLDAIKGLGCEVEYKGETGHFPVVITSHGFGKNSISVNIDKSSQFLSALLIASVLSEDDFEVEVLGSHGMAYIEMTVKMMEQFGAKAEKTEKGYRISKDESFTGCDYDIEPDASAAAYFYAMSPLLNIPVSVPGIKEPSLQGDVGFIKILEKMGCRAEAKDGSILLLPPQDGIMRGVTVDMSACSDQAITLAAIAPFADSPTTITGIGHIRLQESDRLTAIVTELTRMGIKTESGEDFIKIYPGTPNPAEIETYEDHRMAMGFSLTGLRADGIVIKDPGCCKKTFENYFEVLDKVLSDLQENAVL